MLLGDVPILVTVAAWAVTCAAILSSCSVEPGGRVSPYGAGRLRRRRRRRRERRPTRRRRRGRAASTISAVSPRSIRSSRRSTPCQPDEMRSTSSARSSTRALRSAISSCSSRSSRRIALLSSPLISARLRATGSTSRRRPSCTASPTRSGSDVSSCERRRAERLDLLRASAAAPPRSGLSSLRPAACLGDPLRCPFQCLFVHGAQGYSGRRMRSDELDYDAAAGADRAAPGGAAGRLAAARLRPRHRRRCGTGRFADLPDELDRRARRRQRHAGRARRGCTLRRASGGDGGGAAARARSAAASGRRSRARRGGCGPGERLGPVELLEPSARAAGACGSTASRTGEAPLPPYIHEPLAEPGALPDGLRATSPARPRRRRPGCTSRRSCSPGSTSSASRSTSGSTPSGRSRSTTLERARAARRALPRRAGGVGADRGAPSASSPSARRPCACSRRSPATAALEGRTSLFVTAGLRVPRASTRC